MRCRECDADPQLDEPSFCPTCGEQFERKTTADVDWPLRINVAPRINVHEYVSWETGIDQGDSLWEFSDDVELLFDIIVHEDGSVDIDGDSV